MRPTQELGGLDSKPPAVREIWQLSDAGFDKLDDGRFKLRRDYPTMKKPAASGFFLGRAAGQGKVESRNSKQRSI
jgi:hypothetical protein